MLYSREQMPVRVKYLPPLLLLLLVMAHCCVCYKVLSMNAMKTCGGGDGGIVPRIFCHMALDGCQ